MVLLSSVNFQKVPQINFPAYQTHKAMRKTPINSYKKLYP